jgi:hypothetical protein
MWIFKGKGASTMKICGHVPFERTYGLPVEKAIPLLLSPNDSCPKVKVSKTFTRVKDDYSGRIRASKTMLKGLSSLKL